MLIFFVVLPPPPPYYAVFRCRGFLAVLPGGAGEPPVEGRGRRQRAQGGRRGREQRGVEHLPRGAPDDRPGDHDPDARRRLLPLHDALPGIL